MWNIPAKTLYENEVKSPGSLHDVTTGSNGECTKPFSENGIIGLHDCLRTFNLFVIDSGATSLTNTGDGFTFTAQRDHNRALPEEAYVVVAGSGGRVLLDDEVQELRQWDVVRVAPEEQLLMPSVK